MTIKELRQLTTVRTEQRKWKGKAAYTHYWMLANIRFKAQSCPAIAGDILYGVGLDDIGAGFNDQQVNTTKLMNILADYEKAETAKENKQ